MQEQRGSAVLGRDDGEGERVGGGVLASKSGDDVEVAAVAILFDAKVAQCDGALQVLALQVFELRVKVRNGFLWSLSKWFSEQDFELGDLIVANFDIASAVVEFDALT